MELFKLDLLTSGRLAIDWKTFLCLLYRDNLHSINTCIVQHTSWWDRFNLRLHVGQITQPPGLQCNDRGGSNVNRTVFAVDRLVVFRIGTNDEFTPVRLTCGRLIKSVKSHLKIFWVKLLIHCYRAMHWVFNHYPRWLLELNAKVSDNANAIADVGKPRKTWNIFRNSVCVPCHLISPNGHNLCYCG